MAKESSSIGRLEKILDKIEDPAIRDIIKRVIDVEISYRSTDRQNFPWKRIRDIIDSAANMKELEDVN